jgi:hypothetical protein
MKKFRSLLAVAVIIMIGIVGCSKTGDTGPAGVTGPVGPAGPESVYSSRWIDLTFNNTTFDTTLLASTITKSILDSGVILSYFNVPDSLGVSFIYSVSQLGYLFFEEFTVGSIYLAELQNDFIGFKYRYVTIPGKLIAGNGADRKYKGYSVQELKAMPYDKVQQIVADKN